MAEKKRYTYSLIGYYDEIIALYRTTDHAPSAIRFMVGEMCCPYDKCWSHSFPEHLNPDVIFDYEIIEQFEDPERAKQWLREYRHVDPEPWFDDESVDLIALEKQKEAAEKSFNPTLDEMKKKMEFKENIISFNKIKKLQDA